MLLGISFSRAHSFQVLVEAKEIHDFEIDNLVIMRNHFHLRFQSLNDSKLPEIMNMDVERLPSGKMSVNSMILTLSMFAFNTLRFIGPDCNQSRSALALPELLPVKMDSERKRIRKVISDIICFSCKFVRHKR